jgi:hypothetical protein
LLRILERAELDHYPRPEQLLTIFHRMQDFQMQCAADPNRGGYRRGPYKPAADRTALHGKSGARRARIFKSPSD